MSAVRAASGHTWGPSGFRLASGRVDGLISGAAASVTALRRAFVVAAT